MADLIEIRALLDARVADGRFPGYVAAVRVAGETEVLAGGRRAVEPDAPPMTADTLFRIASLTKPIGGALTLVLEREGVLRLDDPVAWWLPEMAAPRVLEAPDAPPDRTVPADRPVTVRHLLTGTSGWGISMTPSPVQEAMQARGVHPGPLPTRLTPDEFVARVAALPLAFPPARAGATTRGWTCSACCSRARRASRWPTSWPSGSPGRSG